VAIGVALLVALALPFLLGPYAISTTSRILAFGLLAMSVTLLTGLTGLPTLGQAAYFGVGAYTAAHVAAGVTAVGPVQVVAAAAVAAVAAAFTGVAAVRVRGVAFIMVTLAIAELAFSAAVRWRSVTRGTDGFSGIPDVVPFWGLAPLELEGLVYYYVLAVFLLLFGVTTLVVRSPFGLVLRGLRDNEARMRAVGYATTLHALAAYTVAGALAGAAGALWVSIQQFVSPGDLGFEVAALALLAAVLGGVGSLWGAVLGAGLVIVTRDYIGGFVEGHAPLLLGVLFVVAVYVIPRGVAGLLERRPATRVEAAA